MNNEFHMGVYSFRTSKGNAVRVFKVKEVGHNGTFAGFKSGSVRSYAVVNGEHVVECKAAYAAPSAVAAAGY